MVVAPVSDAELRFGKEQNCEKNAVKNESMGPYEALKGMRGRSS